LGFCVIKNIHLATLLFFIVLMDFIAEMVLGYIDERLSQCLDKKMDYRIIRYRDDYRIFTNSKKEDITLDE
jgi:hypothetical protein